MPRYLQRKLAKLMALLVLRINEWWRDDSIASFGEIALKTGTCCICGSKLFNHAPKGHFSIVHMYKRATWGEPVATIGTPGGRIVTNFAIALICSNCENLYRNGEEMRKNVKFAVEWNRRKGLVYHNIEDLEDYPLVVA